MKRVRTYSSRIVTSESAPSPLQMYVLSSAYTRAVEICLGHLSIFLKKKHTVLLQVEPFQRRFPPKIDLEETQQDETENAYVFCPHERTPAIDRQKYWKQLASGVPS